MTRRYLLDTNAISDLVRNPQGNVASRIAAAGEESVAISVIVAGELRYGAEKRQSKRLSARLDAVLSVMHVFHLEADVDRAYAAVRAALEAKGTPIGANDLWIAAHATALGLTLVTDNVAEFRRVKGLKVENWMR